MAKFILFSLILVSSLVFGRSTKSIPRHQVITLHDTKFLRATKTLSLTKFVTLMRREIGFACQVVYPLHSLLCFEIS